MAANPISQHQCYTELSSKPVSAIKKKKLSSRAIILHTDND